MNSQGAATLKSDQSIPVFHPVYVCKPKTPYKDVSPNRKEYLNMFDQNINSNIFKFVTHLLNCIIDKEDNLK